MGKQCLEHTALMQPQEALQQPYLEDSITSEMYQSAIGLPGAQLTVLLKSLITLHKTLTSANAKVVLRVRDTCVPLLALHSANLTVQSRRFQWIGLMLKAKWC